MSQFYINPYNFIPYGGNVDRKQRNEETASEPLLTGEIKCSLTVKTPLAIPDAEERFMSKECKDHYIYPFMTAGGVPIIPGSELRGMVRNVFETITNSCFSIINCNTLSKRDGDPLPEAGLLQWAAASGEWKLYEADRRSYFTPSTLKAAKARLDSQGKEYVERKWTLFPSTAKSWKLMKDAVNNAIEKSSTYSDFNNYLEKNGIYILDPDDEDYVDGLSDDPVIVCWKKDFDKYCNILDNGTEEQINKSKINFYSKRINIEKKWGRQYSYSKVVSHLGKPLGREYHESFFSVSLFLRKSDNCMILSEEKISRLIDILDLYKLYNEAGAGQFNAVKPKKDGEMVPVFYQGKTPPEVMLAPAQITRRVYDKTVDVLLGRTDEDPGHSPCTDTKNLCPACRLFGTVSQSGGGAVSSKLRFSDARGSNVTLYPAKIDNEEAVPTLKELSSPKLTSIEFYSLLRNMTGYRDQQRWDYDSDGVYLRGRKIYLHNPKAAVTSEEEIKHAVFCTSGRTKRNASMQLATGGTFTFSVYFNGITESELKTLVWALTLGDAEGTSTLHHKLGHGRPLGLGSVKLQVSEIFKRTTDGVSYATSSETVKEGYFDGFNLLLESDTLTALQTAFDFDYMANLSGNQHVAYPIGRKGSNAGTSENTMQWFSQNHAAVGRNGKYRYVLHPIVKNGRKASISDLLLPYLSDETAGGNASGEQRGNGGQQPAGGQRNNGSQQRGGGNHGGNHGNSNRNTPVTLHPGEESDAVITFIKESRNGQIFINFDANGTPGSLHESKFSAEIRANPEGSIGKIIRVIYLGKDDKGYNKFDIQRK